MSSWLWPPKPSHKTEGWQGVSATTAATTEGESVQASWWMDWHEAWGTPAGHQWDNENLTSQRSWRLEETSLQEETRRGQKLCERMLSSHQGNVNETPEWYLVRWLLHDRTRGSCCKLLVGDQWWAQLERCHQAFQQKRELMWPRNLIPGYSSERNEIRSVWDSQCQSAHN